MNRYATTAFTAITCINSVITIRRASDENTQFWRSWRTRSRTGSRRSGCLTQTHTRSSRTLTHDARRLGLAIHGGRIGAAFRVEWAVMRAYPEQLRLARWPVKAVMLLLALALPPKLFYRLRRRYSILRETAIRISRITAWRARPTS